MKSISVLVNGITSKAQRIYKRLTDDKAGGGADVVAADGAYGVVVATGGVVADAVSAVIGADSVVLGTGGVVVGTGGVAVGTGGVVVGTVVGGGGG